MPRTGLPLTWSHMADCDVAVMPPGGTLEPRFPMTKRILRVVDVAMALALLLLVLATWLALAH
jgi:hypothetical protein